MTDPTTAAHAPEAKSRPRDAAAIEAEIVATRLALADRLDALEYKVRPANIVEAVKQRAIGAVSRPDGSLDPRRLAAVGGAALVFVVYLVRRRKL